MLVQDFDYDLPEELIAQAPCEKRDASKLLVLHDDGEIEHRRFRDIKEYLREGDCLILNDSPRSPKPTQRLSTLALTQCLTN